MHKLLHLTVFREQAFPCVETKMIIATAGCFVVSKIYIAKTAHSELVSFSRLGDKVRIYCPDNVWRKEMSIAHNDWETIKKSYEPSSDLGLYCDTVNAAWQCLGNVHPLNRAEVKILRTKLGHYFPRMWRGLYDQNSNYCYNPVNARSTYGNVYISANVATSSIFDATELLFRYIEPSSSNLTVFGHKIRECFILACTEVESAWRSVLEANSTGKKKSYTTSDYICLVEPLRLTEWSVSLRNYPDLGEYSPFVSWNKSNPSKSLPWYNAYNAVKHHREEKFREANLGNLVDAVAALHIMQSAQFGPEIYDRFFGNEKSPFFVVGHPLCDLPDVYVPNFLGNNELIPDVYFK